MISRRDVLRTAGLGALALGLIPAAASAAAAPPGPQLPPGFAATFGSHLVDTPGLRQHVVLGGDGPPLLLVHGWPQSWYAWRLVMPALAARFRVIAVDQRGFGRTGKPEGGYDTGSLAQDLVRLMDALGHRSFDVVGHDTGMAIGYALAADHPGRVRRLAVAEAIIPGVTPSPPLLLPAARNERLAHFGFNRLPAEVNEALVRGREGFYFGPKFTGSAARPLPGHAIRHYIDALAQDRRALHCSFEWYRALDATIAQNEQRKLRPLAQPVLAIGGAASAGAGVAETMRLAAEDVREVVIPDCGHWVPEEAPGELLVALGEFLD